MWKIDLHKLVDKISERDKINIFSKYIVIKKIGRRYKGLCPFHNDTKIGSFDINPETGQFHCFACGENGNIITFIAKYKGISNVEAIYDIALTENIISNEDYEQFNLNNKHSKSQEMLKTVEKPCLERSTNFDNNVAINRKLDLVYRLFLSKMILSAAHENYLINDRGLSKEIIRKRMYKSYPSINNLTEFLNELNLQYHISPNEEKEKLIEDMLKSIPGFFKKNVNDEWVWNIPKNKMGGIIIPISNAKSEIVGLQVRNDGLVEGERKYTWFSSNFASNYEWSKYGTTSGSPIDVIFPENKPSSTIYITEGRFKSEAIVKTWDSISISVQGVCNWNGIDKEIEIIKKDFPQGYFTNLFIAFDSDIKTNERILKQSILLSNNIREGFSDLDIKHIMWDKSNGKGIDDLILYANINNLRIDKLMQIIDQDDYVAEFNLK